MISTHGKITRVDLPLAEELDKILKPVIQLLDDYGSNYEHENPWKPEYTVDAEYYLYRVRLGAIGRIQTCEDAILLGFTASANACPVHFVSIGHYHIYRIARTTCRRSKYIKQVEKFVNVLVGPKSRMYENNYFMSYTDKRKKK